MTKIKLKFEIINYKNSVSKALKKELGSMICKRNFKNGITISIIADSPYASLKNKDYELAFFKGNCPMDIPANIKEKFKEKVIFNFILSHIPEMDLSWIFKETRKLFKE